MQDHDTLRHECKKCGGSTEHNYVHSAKRRKYMHYARIAISLVCLGMVYPHAIAEDDTTAECRKCGTRVSVPYK